MSPSQKQTEPTEANPSELSRNNQPSFSVLCDTCGYIFEQYQPNEAQQIIRLHAATCPVKVEPKNHKGVLQKSYDSWLETQSPQQRLQHHSEQVRHTLRKGAAVNE